MLGIQEAKNSLSLVFAFISISLSSFIYVSMTKRESGYSSVSGDKSVLIALSQAQPQILRKENLTNESLSQVLRWIQKILSLESQMHIRHIWGHVFGKRSCVHITVDGMDHKGKVVDPNSHSK